MASCLQRDKTVWYGNTLYDTGFIKKKNPAPSQDIKDAFKTYE